jgi:adenine-specific DNA-methyltransferase
MKYIGNKTRLLGFIDDSLQKSGISQKGIFADLFSGTTSVGEYYKKLGFTIISNDFMTYSYVLQKAYIESNEIPKFEELTKYLGLSKKVSGVENVLEKLNTMIGQRGYFAENYGFAGSEKRMYFTTENAQLVDSIREQIQDWEVLNIINQNEKYYLLAILIDAVDHVANMSGTYGAYLKIWRSVALKRLLLKKRQIVNNSKVNKVYQLPAEELIKSISGDILYLDPPYNSRQYAPNFHVLESLAVWDKQPLVVKTGLRDYSKQKSSFSSKRTAPKALKSIVEAAQFPVIALSYNNEGIISHSDIEGILSSYGKVTMFTTDYRRFRTERDHAARKYKEVDDRTKEYLFVLKK